NVACQAGALPGGPSLASEMCMLCILSICESGAHARAIWYILKTADCPVTGSSFSGSFFAVGAGVSEQAVKIARSAMEGNRDGFSIGAYGSILAIGARVRRGTLLTSGIRYWWDNVGSQRRLVWPRRFGWGQSRRRPEGYGFR